MKDLKAKVEQLKDRFVSDVNGSDSVRVHVDLYGIMDRSKIDSTKVTVEDGLGFGYTVFKNGRASYVPALAFIGDRTLENASVDLFNLIYSWCSYFLESGSLLEFEHGAVCSFKTEANGGITFTSFDNKTPKHMGRFQLLDYALKHLFHKARHEVNQEAGFPFGLWSELDNKAYYRAPNPVGQTYSEYETSVGYFVAAHMLGIQLGTYSNDESKILAFVENPEVQFYGSLFTSLQIDIIKNLMGYAARQVDYTGLDGLETLRRLEAGPHASSALFITQSNDFVSEICAQRAIPVPDDSFAIFMNADTYERFEHDVFKIFGASETSAEYSTKFLGKLNGVSIAADAKMKDGVAAIAYFDKTGMVSYKQGTV